MILFNSNYGSTTFYANAIQKSTLKVFKLLLYSLLLPFIVLQKTIHVEENTLQATFNCPLNRERRRNKFLDGFLCQTVSLTIPKPLYTLLIHAHLYIYLRIILYFFVDDPFILC